MEMVTVKNKQGQTRKVASIDLKRWERKGYVPEKPKIEKKPKVEGKQ